MVFESGYGRKKDLEDGLLIDMTDIGINNGLAVSSALTRDLLSEWQKRNRKIASLHLMGLLSIGFREAMESFVDLPKEVEISSFIFLIQSVSFRSDKYAKDFRIKVLVGHDEDGNKCLTFGLPNEV